MSAVFCPSSSSGFRPRCSVANGIATESFDYDADEIRPAEFLNGGTGWLGPWIDQSQFAPAIELSNDDTSLVYPAGVALTPNGSRVRDTGGGVAARAPLQTPIDFANDGEYYISFLLKKESSSNAFFDLLLITPTNQIAALVGLSSSNFARIGVASTTGGDPFDSITPGLTTDTYLFLAKLVTHASADDEYFLNVYRTGVDTVPQVEPISWAAQWTEDIDQAATGVVLTAGTNGLKEFDELVITTTFAEVIGVPEPSTGILLFVGAAAFAAVAHRCNSRRRLG